MKRFSCACGRPVFFENSYCLGCDRPLGFDPESLELLSLDDGGGFYRAAGASTDKRYHHCRNRVEHDVCNWLVPAEALCHGPDHLGPVRALRTQTQPSGRGRPATLHAPRAGPEGKRS